MSKLRAIKNHILFQFEDNIVRRSDGYSQTRSQFSETTDWGFEISSYDEGTKKPRWGVVTSVGPDVLADIKVGSRILIEPLQWSEAIKYNNISYWRTDESKVMALDDNHNPS